MGFCMDVELVPLIRVIRPILLLDLRGCSLCIRMTGSYLLTIKEVGNCKDLGEGHVIAG